MKPLVSIIIVNWNEQKLLRECLTSIKDHTDYPNFNVIVVDNGSTDGSVGMIRRDFSWVKLIESRTPFCFATANNEGIKYAFREGADYVFLLNNDTKVTHGDWLVRMVEVAEEIPNVGIVGCKLLYPDGRIQHAGGAISIMGTFHYGQGKLDNGTYDEIKQVDYVTGAAFMIKKEVVQKIGLLDEKFSPAFYEETDYCIRARIAGYKTIYNPRTTIIHYQGVTVKKRPRLLMNYAWHKNRVRFMLVNFPLKWVLGTTRYELKVVIRGVFERKNVARKLSPLNVRLRNDWYMNLIPLFKAYLSNLKSLREIIQRRRNRTSKVWY